MLTRMARAFSESGPERKRARCETEYQTYTQCHWNGNDREPVEIRLAQRFLPELGAESWISLAETGIMRGTGWRTATGGYSVISGDSDQSG